MVRELVHSWMHQQDRTVVPNHAPAQPGMYSQQTLRLHWLDSRENRLSTSHIGLQFHRTKTLNRNAASVYLILAWVHGM